MASSEIVQSATTTSAGLTQTGPDQQRWLSVPNSRMVLHPYDYPHGGPELDQHNGPTFPMDVGTFAYDDAIRVNNVLQMFHTDDTAPPPTQTEPTVTAYNNDLNSADGWAVDQVSTSASGGRVTIATEAGKEWGSIISPTIQVNDIAVARYLTVKVTNVSQKWNVKINNPATGNDYDTLFQPDSTEIGTFTFDIAKTLGWTGAKSLKVRLWATGGSGASVTFDSVTISDYYAPFADSFGSGGWASSANGVTIAGGTITNGGSSGWGAVAKTVTIQNIENTPLLTVDVANTTAKWALKIRRGSSGNDLSPSLIHDTDQTGKITVDLAAAYNLTGKQTFEVRLFQVGPQGSTTVFNSIAIHTGESWLQPATGVANSWAPHELAFTGTYGSDGQVVGRDQFSGPDAFARVIDSSGLTRGQVVVTGHIGKNAAYDATTNTITYTADGKSISNQVHTDALAVAVALPAGVVPTFDGAATPAAQGTSRWLAILPEGSVRAVGVGFIARTSTTAAAVMAARAAAIAAIADPDADRDYWETYWDEYLSRVPVPQDFSLYHVEADGVTPAQVERMYYLGWITMDMNVMPATPETGNNFASLGTGMASLYDTGTIGVSNSASWDSLLGIQQLVHVDPENAWQTYEGMMALVAEDGMLAGESLPSRKAQTAWILYQVTGDKDRLAATYDDLIRHLRWEEDNMRWMSTDHDEPDEVDSEFTASLYFDLTYAERISKLLGEDAHVAEWAATKTRLARNYEEWFFPAEGRTRGFPTVQKIYLNTSRTSAPSGISVFRDPATQRWTDSGHQFYTSTAMVMDQLADQEMGWVVERFMQEYDPNRQFAGLARIAQKAPDAQLMTYGLIDRGDLEKARIFTNATIRDTVRSKWFAEVYHEAGGTREGTPRVSGVRPSIFGITNLIENIWLNNGYRMDLGNLSAIRLSDSMQGGIAGLMNLGQPLDLDLTADGALLSGPGAENIGCRLILLTSGETSGLDDCVGKDAQITVPTTAVKQGETLTVSGTGFGANEVVQFSIGATGVGSAIANPAGAFAGSVVVPKVTGAQTFVAAGPYSSASIVLTVTAPPDVPPPGGDKSPVTLEVSTSPAKPRVGQQVTLKVWARTTGIWKAARVKVTVNGEQATVSVPASGVASVKLGRATSTQALSVNVAFAGTDSLLAANRSLVVKVAKARSKVKITAKKKLKTGKRLTLRIRVSGPSDVSRAGKAWVLISGKRVRTVKVSHSGKVTVKVKVSKTGIQKVQVRYVGNKNVAKSQRTVKVHTLR
ncbi:hypothetical protein [Rarobacter faecitabidus]|uniref:hypothetical protein n=1 Tax=Rarobacter faecitabidus TaxID=13243 RepID=UPI0011537B20|nr:hypothetical protein [Rarobacter faecitabidus]